MNRGERMYVDDHDQMCGGISGAFTVRLSRDEVRQLLAGKLVVGENKHGRQTKIIVMPEWIDNPGPISSS